MCGSLRGLSAVPCRGVRVCGLSEGFCVLSYLVLSCVFFCVVFCVLCLPADHTLFFRVPSWFLERAGRESNVWKAWFADMVV